MLIDELVKNDSWGQTGRESSSQLQASRFDTVASAAAFPFLASLHLTSLFIYSAQKKPETTKSKQMQRILFIAILFANTRAQMRERKLNKIATEELAIR